MAHQPKGAHWRNLGKEPVTNPAGLDKSSAQILDRLKTPRDPKVTTAHAGVASVGAGGIKPTQPKLDDGNTVANADFNEAAQGPRYRPNTVMVGGK